MTGEKPREIAARLLTDPSGTYIETRLDRVLERASLKAEDLDPERLEMVRVNATRLGAHAVSIAGPESGFDRVLVDAPCSNTGVMRRRIELRWRIKPEEIQRLAVKQLQILKSAAKRCRAGGTIVYSTCSLEREENSAVVRAFLDENAGCQLEAERELTPMENNTDGAYCARIRVLQITA